MNLVTRQTARNSLTAMPGAYGRHGRGSCGSCGRSAPTRPTCGSWSRTFSALPQLAKVRRRLGFRRPSQTDARRIAPAASPRSTIRPTVGALRTRPLRWSMRWICILLTKSYFFRRTSIATLTSCGFHDRESARRRLAVRRPLTAEHPWRIRGGTYPRQSGRPGALAATARSYARLSASATRRGRQDRRAATGQSRGCRTGRDVPAPLNLQAALHPVSRCPPATGNASA